MNHIITNIITRLQAETEARENPLTIQEGEIRKLAKTLGPTQNSVIPYSWIKQNSSLHQAHLERSVISSYQGQRYGGGDLHTDLSFWMDMTLHLSSLRGQTYITYGQLLSQIYTSICKKNGKNAVSHKQHYEQIISANISSMVHFVRSLHTITNFPPGIHLHLCRSQGYQMYLHSNH